MFKKRHFMLCCIGKFVHSVIFFFSLKFQTKWDIIGDYARFNDRWWHCESIERNRTQWLSGGCVKREPISCWICSASWPQFGYRYAWTKNLNKHRQNSNLIFISANAKRFIDGITGQSIVLFTSMAPVQNLGPPPLNLKKILDMAPITVTDQTPMETVVDMFRKLGLRQTLVTHNG